MGSPSALVNSCVWGVFLLSRGVFNPPEAKHNSCGVMFCLGGLRHFYLPLVFLGMDKLWWRMINDFVQKWGIPPKLQSAWDKLLIIHWNWWASHVLTGLTGKPQVLRTGWLAKAFSSRCSRNFTSVISSKTLIMNIMTWFIMFHLNSYSLLGAPVSVCFNDANDLASR